MLKLLCFGEVIIHFLVNQDKPDLYIRHPGGGPANVAVAFSQLGGTSAFTGMIGNDPFGEYIFQSLEDFGVMTDYIVRTSEANTGLVFTTQHQGSLLRSHDYRTPSADLLFEQDNFQIEAFQQSDIFHFCSSTLSEKNISDATETGIMLAKDFRSIISFDVSFNESQWDEQRNPRAEILKFCYQSDIVKFTQAELAYFSEFSDEEELFQTCFNSGVKLILVTHNGQTVRYMTPNYQGMIPIPQTESVGMSASGDAFIAGLLFSFSLREISLQYLTTFLMCRAELEDCLDLAIRCGVRAAHSPGAFSSMRQLEDLAS